MKDIIKIINDNLDKLNKNISTTNLWEIGEGCKWSVEEQMIEPFINSFKYSDMKNMLNTPIDVLYKNNICGFKEMFNEQFYCFHSLKGSFSQWMLESINANISKEDKITEEEYNECYNKNRVEFINVLRKIDAVNKLTDEDYIFDYLGLKGKCFNDFSKEEKINNEK